MSEPSAIDGVLVQWGERLFYPRVQFRDSRTPRLSLPRRQDRAAYFRARIEATVLQRAPQVMVKVTGGGRGMGAIAAHFRYISKQGKLEMEDEFGRRATGRDGVQEVLDEWRSAGTAIDNVGFRREAINIMLSMPRGTDPSAVLAAARAFAKMELSDHRYVMVLHDHQANPHVHLSVRAESKRGLRLSPRKADLRRWRETFAERLRLWGIEAEATSQVTRGSRHRNERVWERKTSGPRTEHPETAEPLPGGIRSQALKAWVEIMHALAASPEVSDRQLAQSIHQYIGRMTAVQAIVRHESKQRERPGPGRTLPTMPFQERRGPEMER